MSSACSPFPRLIFGGVCALRENEKEFRNSSANEALPAATSLMASVIVSEAEGPEYQRRRGKYGGGSARRHKIHRFQRRRGFPTCLRDGR